jgi:hypothetical protein
MMEILNERKLKLSKKKTRIGPVIVNLSHPAASLALRFLNKKVTPS